MFEMNYLFWYLFCLSLLMLQFISAVHAAIRNDLQKIIIRNIPISVRSFVSFLQNISISFVVTLLMLNCRVSRITK
jgi:hypothetical protein